MPRSSSIQKPTTLLTIKKAMVNTNVDSLIRGEIVLITDDGIITGDMRVATGNSIANKTLDKSIPFYPIGSIIYFAGPEPPDGFLMCDGEEYKRDLYPELANYLSGISISNSNRIYTNIRNTGENVGSFYNKGGDFYFRVPDFTINNGLFIRNLNETAPSGNTSLPDYIETLIENDDKGSRNIRTSNINRTFGSFQEESYGWHTHDFTSGQTGFTGEDHVHQYYGAPQATNGQKLGNAYKGNATLTKLFSAYNYDTTDIDSAGELYDMQGMIGTHIHDGYLGYGSSLGDADHNTYHNIDNNFDNSDETRPRNYSLLFCIKY